jgi:hypothetical protein
MDRIFQDYEFLILHTNKCLSEDYKAIRKLFNN